MTTTMKVVDLQSMIEQEVSKQLKAAVKPAKNAKIGPKTKKELKALLISAVNDILDGDSGTDLLTTFYEENGLDESAIDDLYDEEDPRTGLNPYSAFLYNYLIGFMKSFR